MKYYKINNRAVSRRIGDRFFLIPLTGEFNSNETLVETNESGVVLWDAAQHQQSFTCEQLALALQARYNVKPETVIMDVEKWCLALVEANIIREE